MNAFICRPDIRIRMAAVQGRGRSSTSRTGKMDRMITTPGYVRAIILGPALAIMVAGCTTGHGGASTTSTTRKAPATTTTVALPAAPQPSAEAAASALVSSWATGNRPQALSVATPAAVATLFAAPYTAGLAIDRGCNSNIPIVCTFGPPGGSPPTDPLYELGATALPNGWYISSVQINN
jgi:hypothetical protein